MAPCKIHKKYNTPLWCFFGKILKDWKNPAPPIKSAMQRTTSLFILMPAVPPAPCSSGGSPQIFKFAPGLETWASNIVQPNIVRHFPGAHSRIDLHFCIWMTLGKSNAMRALSKISDFKKRVVPTEYAAELLQAFVEKHLVRETHKTMTPILQVVTLSKIDEYINITRIICQLISHSFHRFQWDPGPTHPKWLQSLPPGKTHVEFSSRNFRWVGRWGLEHIGCVYLHHAYIYHRPVEAPQVAVASARQAQKKDLRASLYLVVRMIGCVLEASEVSFRKISINTFVPNEFIGTNAVSKMHGPNLVDIRFQLKNAWRFSQVLFSETPCNV